MGSTHNNKDREANDNGEEEIGGKGEYGVSPASPPAGPLLLYFRVRKGCRPELGL